MSAAINITIAIIDPVRIVKHGSVFCYVCTTKYARRAIKYGAIFVLTCISWGARLSLAGKHKVGCLAHCERAPGGIKRTGGSPCPGFEKRFAVCTRIAVVWNPWSIC